MYLNHLFHSTLYIVFTRVATEHEVHWEGAARDLGGREGGGGRREKKEEERREERRGCLSKEERCGGSDNLTVNVGTFPKKVENFSASMVADVTINFMSFRRDTT